MNKAIAQTYAKAPKSWYSKLLVALLAAVLIAWSSSTLQGTTAGGDGWRSPSGSFPAFSIRTRRCSST